MNVIEILNYLKNKYEEKYVKNNNLLQKYGEKLIESINTDDLSEIILQSCIVAPLLNNIRKDVPEAFNNVIFAAIPMEHINAQSIKGDNNEFLVVINKRFMSLIYSYIELKLIGINNLKQGSNNEKFANYFLPILNCYLNPTVGNQLPVFTSDEITYLEMVTITEQTIACEQFIIAHELAHIYLGHHDKKENFHFKEPEFWYTYYSQNDYQAMEFDADIQAVKWLIDFSNPSSDQNKMLLFLEIFSILNFIESNTMFPDKDSEHPSSISRLNNIKDHFGVNVFSSGGYSIDNMLQNLKDIESFKIEKDI